MTNGRVNLQEENKVNEEVKEDLDENLTDGDVDEDCSGSDVRADNYRQSVMMCQKKKSLVKEIEQVVSKYGIDKKDVRTLELIEEFAARLLKEDINDNKLMADQETQTCDSFFELSKQIHNQYEQYDQLQSFVYELISD